MLPLGVLIPTRNSMQWLDRHLAALLPWLHRVQEVVVVDSHSSDGTAEYLRQHLAGQNIKHFSHPPGLYESWNFGLSQLRSEWAYIATVGDSVPEATIEELVAVGQANSSDLVISPPTMVSESGKPLEKQWPIHKYIKWKAADRAGLISDFEVFLWNTLSVPGSLIGSSASNIYRTEYIQAHPFPEDYRHAGDTAWAVGNSFAARWAIAPGLHSDFLVHPKTHRSLEPVRHQSREWLHELAQAIFESVSVDSYPEKSLYAALLKDYWDASLCALKANRNYSELRKRRYPWFLYAAAWRERSRRDGQAGRADRIRTRILEIFAETSDPAGNS
ncbi:MAG: glycosyltransferase family A protein [Gammaproteobacteria bacterium]